MSGNQYVKKISVRPEPVEGPLLQESINHTKNLSPVKGNHPS